MGKKFAIKYTEPNIRGNSNLQEGSDNNEAEKKEQTTEEGDKKLKSSAEEKSNLENQTANGSEGNAVKDKNKSTSKKMADILDKSQNQVTLHAQNPFLLTREQFDPAAVIKTGYKMRVAYKQTLKLMAETKKGYTIEALLDEALSDYIEKNPEARKAFDMMKMMSS